MTREYLKLRDDYKSFIGLCIPDHPNPDHKFDTSLRSEYKVKDIYECEKLCDSAGEECLAFDTDPTNFDGM